MVSIYYVPLVIYVVKGALTDYNWKGAWQLRFVVAPLLFAKPYGYMSKCQAREFFSGLKGGPIFSRLKRDRHLSIFPIEKVLKRVLIGGTYHTLGI
jgi:hypothetical protein